MKNHKDQPLISKLNQLPNENKEPTKPVTSLGENSTLSVTKTFLLGQNDWKRLENIVRKLNSLSARKIKSSEVIRALIQLGEEIDENKLLNTMRKISY